jgi:hypothetical protein
MYNTVKGQLLSIGAKPSKMFSGLEQNAATILKVLLPHKETGKMQQQYSKRYCP